MRTKSKITFIDVMMVIISIAIAFFGIWLPFHYVLFEEAPKVWPLYIIGIWYIYAIVRPYINNKK